MAEPSVKCPLCFIDFPRSTVQDHAAFCDGVTSSSTVPGTASTDARNPASPPAPSPTKSPPPNNSDTNRSPSLPASPPTTCSNLPELLFAAVETANVPAVEFLLKSLSGSSLAASVNYQKPTTKDSPLHIASRLPSPTVAYDLTGKLLQAGASTTLINLLGFTAENQIGVRGGASALIHSTRVTTLRCTPTAQQQGSPVLQLPRPTTAPQQQLPVAIPLQQSQPFPPPPPPPQQQDVRATPPRPAPAGSLLNCSSPAATGTVPGAAYRQDSSGDQSSWLATAKPYHQTNYYQEVVISHFSSEPSYSPSMSIDEIGAYLPETDELEVTWVESKPTLIIPVKQMWNEKKCGITLEHWERLDCRRRCFTQRNNSSNCWDMNLSCPEANSQRRPEFFTGDCLEDRALWFYSSGIMFLLINKRIENDNLPKGYFPLFRAMLSAFESYSSSLRAHRIPVDASGNIVLLRSARSMDAARFSSYQAGEFLRLSKFVSTSYLPDPNNHPLAKAVTTAANDDDLLPFDAPFKFRMKIRPDCNSAVVLHANICEYPNECEVLLRPYSVVQCAGTHAKRDPATGAIVGGIIDLDIIDNSEDFTLRHESLGGALVISKNFACEWKVSLAADVLPGLEQFLTEFSRGYNFHYGAYSEHEELLRAQSMLQELTPSVVFDSWRGCFGEIMSTGSSKTRDPSGAVLPSVMFYCANVDSLPVEKAELQPARLINLVLRSFGPVTATRHPLIDPLLPFIEAFRIYASSRAFHSRDHAQNIRLELRSDPALAHRLSSLRMPEFDYPAVDPALVAGISPELSGMLAQYPGTLFRLCGSYSETSIHVRSIFRSFVMTSPNINRAKGYLPQTASSSSQPSSEQQPQQSPSSFMIIHVPLRTVGAVSVCLLSQTPYDDEVILLPSCRVKHVEKVSLTSSSSQRLNLPLNCNVWHVVIDPVIPKVSAETRFS